MMVYVKKHPYLTTLALIAVLGGSYWYWSAQTPAGQTSYVTTPVEKGTLTTSVSGSGNVVVDQLASIDPTITGTVAGLAVNVGDSVKKGQWLFTIINEDLTTSALQSQSSLQNAQISLDQANANLVAAKNGGTDTERDRAILKSKITVAEKNLSVAQLNYQNALSDATKRRVTSPIDGTVNAINIKNGDDLSRLSSNSSNQAPMVIGDLNTLKAEVQVNEVDIANVALGQRVMMTYNAISGLSVSGKVEKMDALGTVTQGVVNYTVTVGLDTIDSRLRPGMSVSANIITAVKQEVLMVPSSAVKVQNGATTVQVMKGSDAVPTSVNVQTGAVNNTDTEITSGLSIGDKVVTRTILPAAATSTSSTQSSSSLRIPGLSGGRGN